MPPIDIRDGNPLKRRLQQGEVLLGCFQRIAAPEVTEVCAAAGFDFVVLDLEHALVSESRVADLLRAAEAAGAPALVRLPGHDAPAVGRLLEAGAAGIQAPQVRSVAEAAAVVRATRYPPAGRRGLSTSRQAGYGASMSLADYVEASREWPLVVVQVEDRQGLEAIDAIAAVDGVDVVFVGLTDLSQDLGIPGEYGHPSVRGAVERAFSAIRGCGKAAAVPVTSAEMAEQYISLGATYLTANDTRLLLEASRGFLAGLRGGR
jgi:4-hydroxy-2-oxoheptanedioate aldolase